MIDPDPPREVLRLGDAPAVKADCPAAQPEPQFHRLFDGLIKPPRTVEAAVQRLTVTEHEMEQAIARWTEAFCDWTHLRAQAQPVPASKPAGDGAVRYVTPEDIENITVKVLPRSAASTEALIFRTDGTVDRF